VVDVTVNHNIPYILWLSKVPAVDCVCVFTLNLTLTLTLTNLICQIKAILNELYVYCGVDEMQMIYHLMLECGNTPLTIALAHINLSRDTRFLSAHTHVHTDCYALPATGVERLRKCSIRQSPAASVGRHPHLGMQ